jgi:hypothetical protein
MEAMANPARRMLASFLAVVIVLGCGVLWIGVPIAGFWVAGQLFTKSTHFLIFALLTIPTTMVLVGFLLYRINAIYMALRDEEAAPRQRSGWLVSSTDERRNLRLRRGPRELIDVAMSASIVTALLLMVVWFFFLAQMRLAPLP